MTLNQLIEEKAFPTSTQPSAPMVIRVNDLLEWMLIQAVAGKITLTPELVDGKENTNER
jgi:hypothetical protein